MVTDDGDGRGPGQDERTGSGCAEADRAQLLTLEAFLAGVLLLGSLLFTMQVSAVTPMSASTSSEQVENTQARLAAGLLDAAVANGSLRPTVLAWNESNASFHGAGERGFYRQTPLPTALGQLANRTLGGRDIAYNIHVMYVDKDGSVRQQKLLHVGTPSDNVASAVRTVTLYDNDTLYDASGAPTTELLASGTDFYAPDVAPNSSLYNVVRVKVIVWRT